MVDRARANAHRGDRKQATQGMLVLFRHYLRGLALLSRRPRLAQELQDREQQLKELRSSLARERREAHQMKKQHKDPPPVGGVSFGDLRRSGPISRDFGYDRGLP